VDPSQLMFPARRKFQATDGTTITVVKFIQLLCSSFWRCMYEAVVKIGDQHEKTAVIRLGTRYGRWAHEKLEEVGFAPYLYCEDQYHSEYSEIRVAIIEQLDTVAYKSLEDLEDQKNNMNSCQFSDSVLSAAKERIGKLKDFLKNNNNNIVHGDLRPCNIFINDKGDVKLLDFEFATGSQSTESRYPDVLNYNVYREWGCHSVEEARRIQGTIITPEQDIRMLKYCESVIDRLGTTEGKKRRNHFDFHETKKSATSDIEE